MRTRLLGFPTVLLALLIIAPSGSLSAVECIQNGAFTSGMANWQVNPNLGDWSPLADDGGTPCITTTTQDWEFWGMFMYQDLNVSGVAGKQFTASVNVRNEWNQNPSKGLVMYVQVVDNHGATSYIKAILPVSTSAWNTVSNQFTLPADAAKIVRVLVFRESGDGILARDFSLTADGITVGALPEVTSLSSDAGTYGSTVIISGTGFGTNASGKGEVLFSGSSQGVQIQNWSDTLVTVSFSEPARSGLVQVLVDGTASISNQEFQVTSPHYTLNPIKPQKRVVKGMEALFVLGLDFVNGFTTDSDIQFDVPGFNSICTFTPAPTRRPGGVVLKVDTSSLDAGDHFLNVRATRSGSPDVFTEVHLRVINVENITFVADPDKDWQWEPVTSVNLTRQGEFAWQMEADGSDGQKLGYNVPWSANSSNPAVFKLLPDQWANYTGYSDSSGTANLVVTYPDGSTGTLPITVSLGSEPKVTAVSFSPSQVTNKGDQLIQIYAQGESALRSVSWNVPFNGWLEGNFYNGNLQYQAEAYIEEGARPGTYYLGASTDDSYRVAALTIVNDPSRGEIKGRIFPIDTSIDVFMLMGASIELYDLGNQLVATLGGGHGHGEFGEISETYVQPGTYKIRVTTVDDTFQPQWYPNANSFDEAQAVTVPAGGKLEDLYFFVRAGQQSGAPMVVETMPAAGEAFASVDAVITAEFNRPMNPGAFSESTFTVKDQFHNIISGSRLVDGNTAQFHPDSALVSGRTYTATISGVVDDIDGSQMGEDYTWSFTTRTNKMGDCKQLPDGSIVTLGNKVLHTKAGYGKGYIQEPDRSNGIRIEGDGQADPDSIVTLTGTLQTNVHGERYIQVSNLDIISLNNNTVALGGANKTLQGEMLTGLYVRAFGTVQAAGMTATSFLLSDGSVADPIRVITEMPHSVTPGSWVFVNGAAGIEDGKRAIFARSISN